MCEADAEQALCFQANHRKPCGDFNSPFLLLDDLSCICDNTSCCSGKLCVWLRFVQRDHRKVRLLCLSHAENICPEQQWFFPRMELKSSQDDLRPLTDFSHYVLPEIIPLQKRGLSWFLPHYYTPHTVFPSWLARIFLRPILSVDFTSILCYLHLIQLAVIFPISLELWSQKFSSLKCSRAGEYFLSKLGLWRRKLQGSVRTQITGKAKLLTDSDHGSSGYPV